MHEILIAGLRIIVFGALLSIPGVWLGFWMKKNDQGPNLWWVSVIMCMLMAVFNEAIPQRTVYTYLCWTALAVLGSTVVVYRLVYPASRNDQEDT